MSARAAFIKWSLIGAAAAGMLLYAQAAALGGLEGLLQVGEASALRPVIEADLGPVSTVPGPGHDGQIYYAMALDLDGDVVAPLLDHAGYRYRRILYPALASGFGILDGTPLLWGMVLVVAVSVSVSAGVMASIATGWGRSDWYALAVLLNPGVWLSVRLLTADALALALMLVGLWWLERRPAGSVSSFALSTLAKDVFLVTPTALAASRPRRFWSVAVVSMAALLVWMLSVTAIVGDGFAPRGNLAFPFLGMIDAAQAWSLNDAENRFYLAFTIGAVLTALALGIIRRSWLRLPLLAWAGLALISSSWVWDFGNNAARGFVAIPVLAALSYLPGPALVGDDR